MLFNSFEFLCFFLAFIAIFFSVPRRLQPFSLLVASYIFYMGWRPSFALLLAFTTVVDYTTALMMSHAKTERGRLRAMQAALVINLGILSAVKYLDFMITNVVGVAGFLGYEVPPYQLGLILPLGISFYTFQSVGYTLDVYYRRVEAERDFLTYAQYVAFFPQLVAGPIERAGHMLPQFRRPHQLRYDDVVSGLWLVVYGLFKKMCIADAIAPVVTGVYGHPTDYSGAYHLLATVLFAFQIYCDFSGYSDMARGIARIIGFDLMINFKQPYFATSLTDFWRRWHISLSSWFRDYLYVPLGGGRGSELFVARNLMIVFLVSGIWHGAAWTFVVWGGLHGVGLVVERGFRAVVPDRPRGPLLSGFFQVLGWLWTMSIVLVGWVFFRARSFADAAVTFRSLGDMGHLSYGTFKILGLPSFEILMLGVSLVVLLIVDWQIAFRPERFVRFASAPRLARVAGVAFLYYVIFFGVFGHVDFIYFQF